MGALKELNLGGMKEDFFSCIVIYSLVVSLTFFWYYLYRYFFAHLPLQALS